MVNTRVDTNGHVFVGASEFVLHAHHEVRKLVRVVLYRVARGTGHNKAQKNLVRGGVTMYALNPQAVDHNQ